MGTQIPKAKILYVAYDIEDPDNLMAFRTPEKALEETDAEIEEVYAVYTFSHLVKLEIKSKVSVKIVE